MNQENTNEPLSKTAVIPSYLDRALLKLRRKYSTDEVVAALNKKLSETDIELGKSIAYIDELEAEKHTKSLKNGGESWFEKYKKIKERFDELEKQVKEDELYFKASNEIKRLHIEVRKLKKLNEKLIEDNVILKNETSL